MDGKCRGVKVPRTCTCRRRAAALHSCWEPRAEDRACHTWGVMTRSHRGAHWRPASQQRGETKRAHSSPSSPPRAEQHPWAAWGVSRVRPEAQ